MSKARFADLLATWFGCGFSPWAPGTAGSAAAILIALALHEYAGLAPRHFALLGALAFVPAVWASGETASVRNLKDPGIVVIDEVVGQWLSLAGATELNWKSWAGAFLLFRAFDIWKPPPVRQLEGLRGGLGICADDAMAGVYA